MIEENFRKLIETSDEATLFSIAQNFLEIEQVKELLLNLSAETKEEILENF